MKREIIFPKINDFIEKYLWKKRISNKIINIVIIKYFRINIETITNRMTISIQVLYKNDWIDFHCKCFVPKMLGSTTVRKINKLNKLLLKWMLDFIKINKFNIKLFQGKKELIKKKIRQGFCHEHNSNYVGEICPECEKLQKEIERKVSEAKTNNFVD